MPGDTTRGQSVAMDAPETITISSAASSSNAFSPNGYAPCYIGAPSTTAGSKIRFWVGSTASDLRLLYDETGSLYTVPVVSNAYVRVDPTKLTGFGAMKIETVASDGTTSSTQAGDRTFYVPFV